MSAVKKNIEWLPSKNPIQEILDAHEENVNGVTVFTQEQLSKAKTKIEWLDVQKAREINNYDFDTPEDLPRCLGDLYEYMAQENMSGGTKDVLVSLVVGLFLSRPTVTKIEIPEKRPWLVGTPVITGNTDALTTQWKNMLEKEVIFNRDVSIPWITNPVPEIAKNLAMYQKIINPQKSIHDTHEIVSKLKNEGTTINLEQEKLLSAWEKVDPATREKALKDIDTTHNTYVSNAIANYQNQSPKDLLRKTIESPLETFGSLSCAWQFAVIGLLGYALSRTFFWQGKLSKVFGFCAVICGAGVLFENRGNLNELWKENIGKPVAGKLFDRSPDISYPNSLRYNAYQLFQKMMAKDSTAYEWADIIVDPEIIHTWLTKEPTWAVLAAFWNGYEEFKLDNPQQSDIQKKVDALPESKKHLLKELLEHTWENYKSANPNELVENLKIKTFVDISDSLNKDYEWYHTFSRKNHLGTYDLDDDDRDIRLACSLFAKTPTEWKDAKLVDLMREYNPSLLTAWQWDASKIPVNWRNLNIEDKKSMAGIVQSAWNESNKNSTESLGQYIGKVYSITSLIPSS